MCSLVMISYPHDLTVNEFVKTLHVHTRIEIHFIAHYNSHTHALSRHSNKTVIDKQVYFYRRPVVNPCQVTKDHNRPCEALDGH